jgi:hypothetical protein
VSPVRIDPAIRPKYFRGCDHLLRYKFNSKSVNAKHTEVETILANILMDQIDNLCVAIAGGTIGDTFFAFAGCTMQPLDSANELVFDL